MIFSHANGRARRPNRLGEVKRAKLSIATTRAPNSRPNSAAKNAEPAPVEMTCVGRSRAMWRNDCAMLPRPDQASRDQLCVRRCPKAKWGTVSTRLSRASVSASAVGSVRKTCS